MNKPSRHPDFTLDNHEFWLLPEMVCGFEVSYWNFTLYRLIVEDGILKGLINNRVEILWPQAQNEYKKYRKKLDEEIDKILLDTETESK